MKSRGFLQLFASMSVCLASVLMVTDCKSKGLRYLRLVESMCYSRRAVVFALFLSFLQPVISEEICSPGTAPAPAVAQLTCGGDCLEGCTPLLSASAGTISDGPSTYANGAECWWLIVNPSKTEIQISFSELETDSFDTVRIFRCYSVSCSPKTEIMRLSGSLLPTDKSKIYTSTTGFLQVTLSSDAIRYLFWLHSSVERGRHVHRLHRW
jgi:hypothetical protein